MTDLIIILLLAVWLLYIIQKYNTITITVDSKNKSKHKGSTNV